MRLLTSVVPRRTIISLAVVTLHGLGVLAMYYSVRSPQRPSLIVPLMVWLGPLPTFKSGAPARQRTPITKLTSLRAVTVMPAQVPSVAPKAPNRDSVDWVLESQRSAAATAEDSSQARRQTHAMGSLPSSPYRPSAAAQPSFPWSRHPLTKHFDFDPRTGIITLSTRRCTVAILLIVAGFGCNLGHLDTDPGQGDLFDPKYSVPPLTLPRSLADSKRIEP